MCTKTKNCYGCGHCAKIFEPCNVRGCTEIERYKVPPRDGDCVQCRAGGESVTRGKDGGGRHARAIRSRQSSLDSAASTPYGTPHMTISPWVRSERSPSTEKRWDTPTRRKADDAWVIEHERRMSDLDEKTSKMSLVAHPERGRSSPRSSPHSSYERIVEEAEVEEPEDIEPGRTQTKAIKMLEESPLSKEYRRSRKTSYDSDHSSPYYHTIPIPKTPLRKSQISEHDPHESRQVVHRPRRYGPKTEPYHPQGQSCYFDSPVSGSPIIGSYWQSQSHVVHPPWEHDAYYPRSYPVH